MAAENEHNPRDIMELYRSGAGLLEQAISGLAEADLDRAPGEECWSIRQIVHHLVDGDDLWSLAVKMALGGSEALFDLHWYWQAPQVQWARNWAYARRKTQPAVALFAANRRYILDLIESVPGAWECSIQIPWPDQVPERLTVGQILAMQVRHVRGHIEEIQKIRKNGGI